MTSFTLTLTHINYSPASYPPFLHRYNEEMSAVLRNMFRSMLGGYGGYKGRYNEQGRLSRVQFSAYVR